MKPEEVNAMTNEQLRIKAAELDGWTKCQMGRGEPFGVVPELYTGYPYSEILPDYPNDWAAAGILMEKMQEKELYPELQNVGLHGFLWNLWLDWPGLANSDLVAQDENPKKAITKAFILAMEEE